MKKTSPQPSLRILLPLFALIRMLSSTAFRMVYPFLPVFRDGLGVSLETLTRAIGSRSLVAAVAGPFFASMGDSRGRKVGMLVGIGLFVAGAAFVVFSPTFIGFTLAMMLTSVGKVTFDPAVQAYLGDRVPYAQRSFAITMTELSWSGAYILGIPVIGLVIARAGWMAPFPLLGLLVLLTGVALAFILPKDKARTTVQPSFLSSVRALRKSRSAMSALGFTAVACVANEMINLVFGVWMEGSFGLKLAALGASAAVLGIAEVSGEGSVAVITDRLGKRRAIFYGLLLNTFAIVALPLVQNTLVGALSVLFVYYISFEFVIISSIPLMTEVFPSARATMMSGFYTTAGLGRAFASWISAPLYAFGFGATVLVALAFNVLAIVAIRGLDLPAEPEMLS